MEPTEVIKKNEKKFKWSRRMLQLLLVMIVAIIIYLQYENIIRFFKWISPGS